MIAVGARLKSQAGSMAAGFFDRQEVIDRFGKENIKILSKMGAFVRQRAKSSIRKRKKPSRPGSPPSSHTGLLKGRLFFAYDKETDTVVVGPEKTNQVFFSLHGKPVTGTVPEVLEEGGMIRVLEEQILTGGRWFRSDLRSRNNRPKRLRSVTIAARPYMNPAYQAELPKFAPLWRNSVTA